MKKLNLVVLCLIVGSLMAGLFAGCTSAGTGTSGGKWTPTKSIEIVVPLGPGSSYDTYARGIAPYLKKQLGVDVTVKNVTGASGLNGLLSVWRAAADGYTLVFLDVERFVGYEIFSKEKPEFSLDGFNWIGEPARGYYVLSTGAKTPYKTIKDLVEASKTKPVRMVGTDVGTTAIITQLVTGMKTTFVISPGGGADLFALLARGDGDMVDVTTTMTLPFLLSGDARAVMLYADKPYPLYTENNIKVQTAVEAGYPELAALYGPRGIAAPPKTPDNILQTLRDAFNNAMKDPELIAWSKTAKAPIIPGTDSDLKSAIDALRKICNDPRFKPELAKAIQL